MTSATVTSGFSWFSSDHPGQRQDRIYCRFLTFFPVHYLPASGADSSIWCLMVQTGRWSPVVSVVSLVFDGADWKVESSGECGEFSV